MSTVPVPVRPGGRWKADYIGSVTVYEPVPQDYDKDILPGSLEIDLEVVEDDMLDGSTFLIVPFSSDIITGLINEGGYSEVILRGKLQFASEPVIDGNNLTYDFIYGKLTKIEEYEEDILDGTITDYLDILETLLVNGNLDFEGDNYTEYILDGELDYDISILEDDILPGKLAVTFFLNEDIITGNVDLEPEGEVVEDLISGELDYDLDILEADIIPNATVELDYTGEVVEDIIPDGVMDLWLVNRIDQYLIEGTLEPEAPEGYSTDLIDGTLEHEGKIEYTFNIPSSLNLEGYEETIDVPSNMELEISDYYWDSMPNGSLSLDYETSNTDLPSEGYFGEKEIDDLIDGSLETETEEYTNDILTNNYLNLQLDVDLIIQGEVELEIGYVDEDIITGNLDNEKYNVWYIIHGDATLIEDYDEDILDGELDYVFSYDDTIIDGILDIGELGNYDIINGEFDLIEDIDIDIIDGSLEHCINDTYSNDIINGSLIWAYDLDEYIIDGTIEDILEQEYKSDILFSGESYVGNKEVVDLIDVTLEHAPNDDFVFDIHSQGYVEYDYYGYDFITGTTELKKFDTEEEIIQGSTEIEQETHKSTIIDGSVYLYNYSEDILDGIINKGAVVEDIIDGTLQFVSEPDIAVDYNYPIIDGKLFLNNYSEDILSGIINENAVVEDIIQGELQFVSEPDIVIAYNYPIIDGTVYLYNYSEDIISGIINENAVIEDIIDGTLEFVSEPVITGNDLDYDFIHGSLYNTNGYDEDIISGTIEGYEGVTSIDIINGTAQYVYEPVIKGELNYNFIRGKLYNTYGYDEDIISGTIDGYEGVTSLDILEGIVQYVYEPVIRGKLTYDFIYGQLIKKNQYDEDIIDGTIEDYEGLALINIINGELELELTEIKEDIISGDGYCGEKQVDDIIDGSIEHAPNDYKGDILPGTFTVGEKADPTDVDGYLEIETETLDDAIIDGKIEDVDHTDVNIDIIVDGETELEPYSYKTDVIPGSLKLIRTLYIKDYFETPSILELEETKLDFDPLFDGASVYLEGEPVWIDLPCIVEDFETPTFTPGVIVNLFSTQFDISGPTNKTIKAMSGCNFTGESAIIQRG